MHTVSSTKTKTTSEWNTLHSKHTYWIVDVPNSELSSGLVKRCVSYATKRMENFPLDHSKIENIHITKNDSDFITVAFRGKFGAIKVNGILIGKGGWPFIDHGISFDENDII